MQTPIQKAIEDIKGYKSFGKTIDIDFVVTVLNTYSKEEKQEISDEEIKKAVNEYAEVYQCPSEISMCKHDVISAWNNAIKWYREQLKSK